MKPRKRQIPLCFNCKKIKTNLAQILSQNDLDYWPELAALKKPRNFCDCFQDSGANDLDCLAKNTIRQLIIGSQNTNIVEGLRFTVGFFMSKSQGILFQSPATILAQNGLGFLKARRHLIIDGRNTLSVRVLVLRSYSGKSILAQNGLGFLNWINPENIDQQNTSQFRVLDFTLKNLMAFLRQNPARILAQNGLGFLNSIGPFIID